MLRFIELVLQFFVFYVRLIDISFSPYIVKRFFLKKRNTPERLFDEQLLLTATIFSLPLGFYSFQKIRTALAGVVFLDMCPISIRLITFRKISGVNSFISANSTNGDVTFLRRRLLANARTWCST